MLYEVITRIISSSRSPTRKPSFFFNKMAPLDKASFRGMPFRTSVVDPSPRTLLLLTSYSIHYTKLYDPVYCIAMLMS